MLVCNVHLVNSNLVLLDYLYSLFICLISLWVLQHTHISVLKRLTKIFQLKSISKKKQLEINKREKTKKM